MVRTCDMFYVYILRSHRRDVLYTGFTVDLKKRLAEHMSGKSTFTKGILPVQLIYYEAYISEDDACKREVFLKSGRGREVLRKHLSQTLGGISSTG